MTGEETAWRAIDEWHASVNVRDLPRAANAVGGPIVVLGARGAGRITPDQFAEWVRRSGIHLEPRAWHQVGDRLVVVEQDATWPESPEPTRVATVFRVHDGKVTAALRFPDVESALQLAHIHQELAATE